MGIFEKYSYFIQKVAFIPAEKAMLEIENAHVRVLIRG